MHLLYEIEHLSTHGGIERILTDKANYIADRWGWKVTIVVLLDEPETLAYPLSPNVDVKYLHIKSKGVMMCLLALWKLNNIIRELRPDIYITFQTIGAMSSLLRTHHIPVIYEAHGIRTCMQHPLAMSMAEKYADCVVVLTDKNAERYGKARKVVRIPNFTNVKSLSLPDYSRKHCVAVGRLDFEKDYIRMINLWKKLHTAHHDWILDIYGEGREHHDLQITIDRLGLSKSVVLHGETQSVASAFQRSSICLMTSRFEGFSLVLVEAGVCGTPCVAFDCDDGPRDIIEDGKTGCLIPYDDDQMFVDKLSALMDDEVQRRSMGEAARAASQRFQPEPIMEQWKELFESLSK